MDRRLIDALAQIASLNARVDQNIAGINNNAGVINTNKDVRNQVNELVEKRLKSVEDALHQHIGNYTQFSGDVEGRLNTTMLMGDNIQGALEVVRELSRSRGTGQRIRHEEAKHHIPSEWNSDEPNKMKRAVDFAKFQKELKNYCRALHNKGVKLLEIAASRPT